MISQKKWRTFSVKVNGKDLKNSCADRGIKTVLKFAKADPQPIKKPVFDSNTGFFYI